MIDETRQPRPTIGARARGPARESVKPRRRLPSGTLEAALHQIAEGVIIADCKGRFVFWNEAASRLVGAGPSAVAPRDWASAYGCYLPDGVTPYPAAELPLARAIRGEHVRDVDVFIRSARAPRGTWINVNGGPLRGAGREALGGIVVFRDVTAQRSSDQRVKQLSQAVEKTADAVFITDVAGVIEYVNPAFEAMTGYSRQQAIGRRASLLKSGWQDRAYYQELWAQILAGRSHSATLVNRKKDGAFFHAEQTITPVPDSAGKVSRFVSVMRDVTRLKRAQEREVEMRLARAVQQKLYPTHAPCLPGFEMAGAAFPADETCGDYYDFVPMRDGRLGLAIGDVSGHGLGAALLVAETRAYLRSLARTSADLAEIFTALNAFLLEDTAEERFVTLLLALVDPVRRSLVYASAGHIDGYVLDAAGSPRRQLSSTSPPLGLFPDAEFHPCGPLPLGCGDTIALLTDGVTEAQNRSGEFFECGRTLACLAQSRSESAASIVKRLKAAVSTFMGDEPQRDDITAVVCRVL